MGVDRRIGMSTHFIPMTYGESLEEVVRAVSGAGIRAFELVPAKYQAQIGWPYNIPNVGVWYRDMSAEDLASLGDVLSVFDVVTIHGQHLDVNIASCNIGVREESVRQYMECLELARKLDVGVVTFHMGRQTMGYIRSEEEILKYDLEFAERAAEYARSHGLRVGYETGSIGRLRKVLELLGPREFGVNLDLGHVVMQGADPLELIDAWRDRIIEVHFNGVVHYWGGFMEHVPVPLNNSIDYRRVIPKLRDSGFRGPIICELQGNDLEQCIDVVLEAKELIEFLWHRDELLPGDVKPWRLPKILRGLKARHPGGVGCT